PRKLLDRLKAEFEPKTWELFRRFVLDGAPADEVAAELGATPNAVYIAKSRVLARLREEAVGLLG
ncbi:MAG TPA: sigma-70 family RNA polymerase sigma factor, partial [Gemmataceae bacterium]|nr:sigma-70 family RNA polymerase sigma factor [Gemmataceae bacterium]